VNTYGSRPKKLELIIKKKKDKNTNETPGTTSPPKMAPSSNNNNLINNFSPTPSWFLVTQKYWGLNNKILKIEFQP
jgi:hypothetical protein